MPAPVVVVKDVGGFVADYQTQTAIYRATGREVRLHECRSACTLALSLPNVCVYPDSTLKFHLAYDPRDHVPNAQVSQQMFGSYPAPVQARLGSLTREYKILRGSELIALGIRDCTTPKPDQPKIMVASAVTETPPRGAVLATEQPLFTGMFDKLLSVLGVGEANQGMRSGTASAARAAPGPKLLADIPVPPPRPVEFARAGAPDISLALGPADTGTGAGAADTPQTRPLGAEPSQAADTSPRAAEAQAQGSPLPAARAQPRLPPIMTGAQPVLPPNFRAFAELDR